MKSYIKKWMQEQRKRNTPYAARQRRVKREYCSSPAGKIVIHRWRHENIEKILQWNRKRLLKKKGVKGSHTLTEWRDLKRIHNFECVKCHIPEKELEQKWKGTNFTRLTRDHCIPISKGGTDNIDNIMPMCVSCNSRKRNNL